MWGFFWNKDEMANITIEMAPKCSLCWLATPPAKYLMNNNESTLGLQIVLQLIVVYAEKEEVF